MKKKTRTLFDQELQNHEDIRLKIINDAIFEYTIAKSLSDTHMKEHIKHTEENGTKYFHYQGDLIVSIQNGYTVKKGCYEIVYFLNDCIGD